MRSENVRCWYPRLFFSFISTVSPHWWPFVLFLWIGTLHGEAIAGTQKMGLQDSYVPLPTHSNFFRYAQTRGRQRTLSCAADPTVCADREKNPWGGDTCCFQQSCKDIMRDADNCGACGHVCTFGLVCCGGRCVDVRNDPHNCGSCFEECPAQSRCSYAMCDYAG